MEAAAELWSHLGNSDLIPKFRDRIEKEDDDYENIIIVLTVEISAYVLFE